MKRLQILLITILTTLAALPLAAKTSNDGIAYFNARVVNNREIELTWTAGIAINETGFDIERLNASGNWEKIGFIKNGNIINDKATYIFNDPAPFKGLNTYRLKHNREEGSFLYSDELRIQFLNSKSGLFYQNYPNPFTATTLIKYEVTTRGPVRIFVFDLSGMQLAQLVNKQDEMPGVYTVQWNAINYAPGTYIYKIMTADGTVTQKMMKAR